MIFISIYITIRSREYIIHIYAMHIIIYVYIYIYIYIYTIIIYTTYGIILFSKYLLHMLYMSV